MVYSSSDSGTDTKEKDQNDYRSTSFDSNSEVEFGDDEGNSAEIVSSSEEENSDIPKELIQAVVMNLLHQVLNTNWWS